jgi:hypothetical protein
MSSELNPYSIPLMFTIHSGVPLAMMEPSLDAAAVTIAFVRGRHAPSLVVEIVPATTTLVYFGQSVGALITLERYGTWKFLDSLMSCRFFRTDCEFAFGNVPEWRIMGTWSDGTPVSGTQIEINPEAPPASSGCFLVSSQAR